MYDVLVLFHENLKITF